MRMHKLTYYCSNQLGRIILQGMQEVMGVRSVDAVLSQADLSLLKNVCSPQDPPAQIPYQQISGIQSSLERMYGRRGGQGLAVRSGRASFRYGLREFGEQAGITNLDFRLLPPRTKVQIGARALAQALSQLSDQKVRVEEQERTYQWIVERCPLCWGRHADVPVCHLSVGFLQEFLYWAGAGKYYPVVETECSAAGATACVFSIDKLALD